METLSKAISRIKLSPTIELNQKAKALSSQGRSIINLTTGEPDFPTPLRICKAAYAAMEKGETGYTPAAGIVPLRKAILKEVEKIYQRKYSLDQVVVTVGAKQALFNLCLALLNEGDEAIIFSPYWVSYVDLVEMVGARPVVVETLEQNQFIPDLRLLERKINEQTRLLFLNSPSNPTGVVYPRSFFQELVWLLRKWPGLKVVTDDIYSKLIFDQTEFVSLGMFEEISSSQLIIVDGVSKSFAMTGWRIGWAVGPSYLISGMVTLSSQSTTNPSSVSQWAALEALTGEGNEVEEMRQSFEKRRDFTFDLLQEIPGISCLKPQGAFYLFPNISSFLGKKTPDGKKLKTDMEIASYLLEKHGLALVPGTAFGLGGYLRLSYGASQENLEEGIRRLKQGLSELAT